jgi:hypothetical protein
MERISSATVSFNFLGTLASTFLATWTWQRWTLDWINRASGFLKREASGCLERSSIRAGFFCQTPDAVFVLRRSGKRRGTNPNCILDFPQTHTNPRFLSHIDNFGLSPYDR